jgi:hypothetical protein
MLCHRGFLKNSCPLSCIIAAWQVRSFAAFTELREKAPDFNPGMNRIGA